MVILNDETRSKVELLATTHNLKVIWDDDPDSKFQEQVRRDQRTILVKTHIEPEDFDYLFNQHDVDYPIKRNQDMFLFNVIHGIGHFILDLWVVDTSDSTVNRLTNFFQDKKIDKWAFETFESLREQKLL